LHNSVWLGWSRKKAEYRHTENQQDCAQETLAFLLHVAISSSTWFSAITRSYFAKSFDEASHRSERLWITPPAKAPPIPVGQTGFI
jgi:hypothetical protein